MDNTCTAEVTYDLSIDMTYPGKKYYVTHQNISSNKQIV